jgi:transcriptional regulator
VYLPRSFHESNINVLHELMRRWSFATVISHDAELHVSHLPLLVASERGPKGTLLGHMARANKHWRDFDGRRSATCVFHGPHAYISPSWYKQQPAVPTWNYAVVHASGRPRIVDDPAALEELLDQTMAVFDPALANPAAPGHPPADYRASLLAAIVGFEIAIEHIEGKLKLGQNRSAEDQAGIARALAEQGGASTALLDLMTDRAGPSR